MDQFRVFSFVAIEELTFMMEGMTSMGSRGEGNCI